MIPGQKNSGIKKGGEKSKPMIFDWSQNMCRLKPRSNPDFSRHESKNIIYHLKLKNERGEIKT